MVHNLLLKIHLKQIKHVQTKDHLNVVLLEVIIFNWKTNDLLLLLMLCG